MIRFRTKNVKMTDSNLKLKLGVLQIIYSIFLRVREKI